MANIFSDTVTVARPRPQLQLKHRLGQFLEEDGAPLVLNEDLLRYPKRRLGRAGNNLISGRRYARLAAEGKAATLRRSLQSERT